MLSELLDHPLISERYFFPRDGYFKDPFQVNCGDAQLACSYHEIDPAAKTLIHFHGNGEIVDDWQGVMFSWRNCVVTGSQPDSRSWERCLKM